MIVLGLTACTQTPLEKIESHLKDAAEGNLEKWSQEDWKDFYIDALVLISEFYEADPTFEETEELYKMAEKYGNIIDDKMPHGGYKVTIWADLRLNISSKIYDSVTKNEEWDNAYARLESAWEKWYSSRSRGEKPNAD